MQLECDVACGGPQRLDGRCCALCMLYVCTAVGTNYLQIPPPSLTVLPLPYCSPFHPFAFAKYGWVIEWTWPKNYSRNNTLGVSFSFQILIPIISFEANNKKGKDKKNYDGAIVNSMTPFAALSFLGVADYKMCEEIRSAATFDKFWNLNTFPLWAVHGGSLYRHLLLLLFRAMESLSLSYTRVPLCSSPFYCEGGLVTSSMCRKMSAQERCKEVKKRKRKVWPALSSLVFSLALVQWKM